MKAYWIFECKFWKTQNLIQAVNMTDLKRSVLSVKLLLSLFSLRAPLVCGQLLLQQHELLPRLPQLLVQLGPGLVEAGTGVAARDDPGRCGPQVGVGVYHAQDQVVKVLGEAVQVLELASLYVLVVGVVEAVPREDLEAGGLVDGQTEAEDVRLGQLARVHVHLEELGRHVAAVSLLRSHRGSAVDGRHVTKVSDLVAYLIVIMIIVMLIMMIISHLLRVPRARVAAAEAPCAELRRVRVSVVMRRKVTGGCARVGRLLLNTGKIIK